MRQDQPEERLLRLIKGEHKKKNDTKSESPAVKGVDPTEILKSIFLKNKTFKPSLLKKINRVLLIFLAVLSAYALYSFFFKGQAGVARREEKAPRVTDISPSAKEETAVSEIKDYSSYEKEIRDKPLFSTPPTAETREIGAPEEDLSKKFNLVGILAGDNPQAIIEDKEAQKTYYLYKGQSFSGATVEEIGDGKVVLSYKGREIVLVL